MRGLSIVVPCHNEEGKIAETIEYLMSIDLIDKEIIVVNDGSNDGTEKILQEYANKVHIVTNKECLGYGASIKKAVKKSKYDLIAITDADGTYPNDQIIDFHKILIAQDYDMVVGARTKKNVKIPLIRKPAKWFITQLANYLSGHKIPDLNSGLRVFKKELFMEFINIIPQGFSLTTTITLAFLTSGYAVKYVPIDYFARSGSSKIRPIRDTLNFILLIVRTVMFFNPLKVFVPLALFFFLAAIILLSYGLAVGEVMDSSFAVLVVAAVQFLFMGVLADFIDRKIK